MMLEAMYEEYFENTSHGFRPRRSCHTALIQVQKNFTATKWFVEGDIEGFFDNINHDVLIGILKERIADERFIRLIRKFLKAGYIEDWVFHKTYSGTPQGGIISPDVYKRQLLSFSAPLSGSALPCPRCYVIRNPFPIPGRRSWNGGARKNR